MLYNLKYIVELTAFVRLLYLQCLATKLQLSPLSSIFCKHRKQEQRENHVNTEVQLYKLLIEQTGKHFNQFLLYLKNSSVMNS